MTEIQYLEEQVRLIDIALEKEEKSGIQNMFVTWEQYNILQADRSRFRQDMIEHRRRISLRLQAEKQVEAVLSGAKPVKTSRLRFVGTREDLE